MSDRAQSSGHDDRWEHGMDGWRIRVTSMVPEHRGRLGEVTGCDPAGPYVYVVMDGEAAPVRFWWSEVRPA